MKDKKGVSSKAKPKTSFYWKPKRCCFGQVSSHLLLVLDLLRLYDLDLLLLLL